MKQIIKRKGIFSGWVEIRQRLRACKAAAHGELRRREQEDKGSCCDKAGTFLKGTDCVSHCLPD